MLQEFKQPCRTHPQSGAHGNDTVTYATEATLIEEGDGLPCTSCAQWVTECDGAAVDIYPIHREGIDFVGGEYLRGERFVELDQVYVVQMDSRLFQQFRDGI